MKMPWNPASDEEKLNKLIQDEPINKVVRTGHEIPTPQAATAAITAPQATDYCQWSAGPNDTYRPSGPRREKLPCGVYLVAADQMGPFFIRSKVVTDNLIELDDAASNRVLQSIRKFWKSRDKYVKRGVLYKRGLLLWGPAGSGKTATLTLLMNDLLKMDGLVFICHNPELLGQMLAVLRRIEPERNIIVVYEDIDELIQNHGEHDLLALLDGESQIDNVCSIATTNYPERLGARIINRPSRFDERIFVDMPNESSREKYLRHITKDEQIDEETLRDWVKRTNGFSVAHLRELAVAVFCLDQDFEEVLERLSKMQYQPKALKEFTRNEIGLQAAQPATSGFAASSQFRIFRAGETSS